MIVYKIQVVDSRTGKVYVSIDCMDGIITAKALFRMMKKEFTEPNIKFVLTKSIVRSIPEKDME